MDLRVKLKAGPAALLRSNRAIETHYARHKACNTINDELDALDPQNYIDKNATADLVRQKGYHDREAARFRQLAVEQDNKSKDVQKEIDTVNENGERKCNNAEAGILKRRDAAEASLLRAKSRLNETLNTSLKENAGHTRRRSPMKRWSQVRLIKAVTSIVLTLEQTATMTSRYPREPRLQSCL